jgi:hypothetical protein
MKAFWLASLVGTLAVGACGEVPGSYVIAGPTAPGRVVTEQPLVWDSREELLDWASNAITRGPITVEGEGRSAFIRIGLGPGNYVLRGPDLAPVASAVRGARLRARLRLDRPRPSPGIQSERVELYFDVVNPIVPNAQASVYVAVPPSDEWQDLALLPGLYCCLQPLTVRYAYVPLRSTTPATLDIDRIELTR